MNCQMYSVGIFDLDINVKYVDDSDENCLRTYLVNMQKLARTHVRTHVLPARITPFNSVGTM